MVLVDVGVSKRVCALRGVSPWGGVWRWEFLVVGLKRGWGFSVSYYTV